MGIILVNVVDVILLDVADVILVNILDVVDVILFDITDVMVVANVLVFVADVVVGVVLRNVCISS